METKTSLILCAAALFSMTTIAMAGKTADSQIVVPLPANPTAEKAAIAKAILIEGAFVDEMPAILAITPIQSQTPQPVVMRNYYLTPQAKEAVLPYWQGPRPLRLRNPFLGKLDEK